MYLYCHGYLCVTDKIRNLEVKLTEAQEAVPVVVTMETPRDEGAEVMFVFNCLHVYSSL